MIIHCQVYCDVCNQHLGQLWNEPPAARDLLPAPDFRVCDDCVVASHAEWTAFYESFNDRAIAQI